MAVALCCAAAAFYVCVRLMTSWSCSLRLSHRGCLCICFALSLLYQSVSRSQSVGRMALCCLALSTRLLWYMCLVGSQPGLSFRTCNTQWALTWWLRRPTSLLYARGAQE
ncbi:hypothetical protein HDK77DRAFT_143383 [Phyllosticta capitalensis]